ncbi:hypothetical protein OEZ86_009809 [Tetradesmus obliquus]|uniref:Uncharacterized protein n=1 Tax=Tetradesmus obliquus TaxID=3088 RepID=A0ABY8UTJ1_TETOB|nr:hypothetical protein OEZ85_001250 [Tetradesmus obliquus]WIA43310.1 hypothetical protein OEZ86_009809 [Tetradesmus obliquus]
MSNISQLALGIFAPAFILYTLEQKLHMAFVMRERSHAANSHDSSSSSSDGSIHGQELPAFAFTLWCLPIGLLVLLGCMWVAVCCQISWLVLVDLHNLPLQQLL